MANNDIDRLFREGLDQLEIAPAAKSWEDVQSKVATRKNSWRLPLGIAAAMAAIITATFIVAEYPGEKPSSEWISSVDHPRVGHVLTIELPTEILSTGSEAKKKVEQSAPASAPPRVLEETRPDAVQEYTLIAVAPLRGHQLKAEIPTSLTPYGMAVEEEESFSVKITYIASNQPDSTKSSKLNNLISYLSSAEVSPTELLADIRDVKDNLFSKN